jgi:hypothetical protein
MKKKIIENKNSLSCGNYENGKKKIKEIEKDFHLNLKINI